MVPPAGCVTYLTEKVMTALDAWQKKETGVSRPSASKMMSIACEETGQLNAGDLMTGTMPTAMMANVTCTCVVLETVPLNFGVLTASFLTISLVLRSRSILFAMKSPHDAIARPQPPPTLPCFLS